MAINFPVTAGTANLVQYEDVPSFYTVPFSISFWLRMNAQQSQGGWVIGFARLGSFTNYYSYVLHTYSGGGATLPIFHFIDAAGSWYQVDGKIMDYINTWYHHTITVNSSYDLKFYTNGALLNTNTSPTSLNTDSTSGFGLRIGTDGADWSQFNGQHADFRFYNIELLQPEISAIYLGRGRDNINNNLITRWTFSEGYPGQAMSGAGSIKDMMGNRNGNVYGSPEYYQESFLFKRRRTRYAYK